MWAKTPDAEGALGEANSNNVHNVGRPIVRIVSPKGHAIYVMPDSEASILVVLEIVDTTGAGIDSLDSGVPRFVDPDKNVELFVEHLIANHRYTDSYNQSVIQLASVIPVSKLVREKDWSISAPVDVRNLPPAWRESDISVPKSVAFAKFSMIVKDLNNVLSSETKQGFPNLVVGFADSAYLPEGTLPPENSPSDKP